MDGLDVAANGFQGDLVDRRPRICGNRSVSAKYRLQAKKITCSSFKALLQEAFSCRSPIPSQAGIRLSIQSNYV